MVQNKAKKDQNFRVTITYKKKSLMQATNVNINDVKNLKIDENEESNTPAYKIKGEFVHKNDSVFSDIHDVRLIFTSINARNSNKGWDMDIFGNVHNNKYSGYNSDYSSSDASST